MNDPKDLINNVASVVSSELNEHPFLCVTCGSTFDCLEDVIFHILSEHEMVMCMMANGKLISYNDFLEMLSRQMIDTISNDGQS